MLVMAAMDVLCMGGIAFCLRFLVALFQERKPRRIGDRVRPELSSGEKTQCQAAATPAAHESRRLKTHCTRVFSLRQAEFDVV